jgi:hypothetical protein
MSLVAADVGTCQTIELKQTRRRLARLDVAAEMASLRALARRSRSKLDRSRM